MSETPQDEAAVLMHHRNEMAARKSWLYVVLALSTPPGEPR